MGDFDDINVKINVDASGAEQGLTRVSTSLNKLNSDVGKLGTGADFGDKLNSEAKQAEGGLDKLGEAAEQANQKLAKIGSGLNLSSVGSQLDALSGKMQSWGAGLSILAAPFELVGAASVNAFVDFEAGMGKIFTLLPDITEKGMSEMSAQIKEFSTTFGADLSTVQQAAYDALSSGVSQADLMPFIETAQTAAVAGMSDVGTAVDGLTSAINAYQMELDDAGRVSDVFFKTVELGKIEFDELSRNIGKVAPTAAQFGISIEDTGAAIAAITSQGVSAEETMTGLKNLFKDVATPGTQLNKIFQEIAGVTFKDFIANGGTLAEAVSKLRDYSQQTGKSFFEMGSTFESANSLAMLGGGFFEKYAEMTEEIGSAAGSTESAYGKMSDTMAFAIGKLKSQFQVMSVDIGEKLAPVVLEFTQWLTENADKISDFAQNVASAAVPAIESIFDTLQKGMDMYDNMSPETKSMLAKLIGVGAVGAAVAGPGLLIGGTALSPVASLITMMGNLQTSSLLAKAAMGGVGTEASIIAGSSGAAASGLGGISTALAGIGPLGWAAAAALAAAGAAYVTNFGGFRDNINDAVKEAESAIKNFNTGNYEQAGTDAAEAMAKGLGSFGDLAVDAVKATPEALQAGEEFVSAFQDGVNQSADSFGSESAKLLLSAMKSGIESGAGVLSGVGRTISNAIQNGITIDGISSYLIDQLSDISLESVGGTLAQSLISGFTHANFGPMGDVVEKALKGVGKGTIDWIQEEIAKLTGTTKEEVQTAASKIPIIGGIIGGDYETTPSTTSAGFGLANKPGWVDPHFAYASYQENKALLSDASDVISKLAEEKDISYESAKKMYDSSEKFAASVDKKYGKLSVTTGTPSPITTPTTGEKAWKGAKSWEEASALGATIDEWNNRFNDSTQKITQTTDSITKTQTKIANDQAAASKKQADTLAKAESSYADDLYKAQLKRSRAIEDLDKTDKNYNEKLTKIEKTYERAVEDAEYKYAKSTGSARNAEAAANIQIDANEKLAVSSNTLTDVLSKTNAEIDKSSNVWNDTTSSIQNASSEFQNLSNRAQNLETQYKSGRITQDDYIESIKELSREYDTLSRNTNTFKGEEKDAVEGYIRNLKNLINHYEYGTEPAEKYLDKIIALNDAWLNSASVIESTVESINASVDKSGKYQPEAGTEASKALEDLSKLKTAVYGESVDSAKNFEEWATEQTYKRLTTYINAGWDEATAKLATEGDIYADYLQYRGGVASMPGQAGYGATRRTYAQGYYDEGGKAIAKAFTDAMFEDDIYSKIKSGQYTASREFEGDKNDPLMWRRIDIVDKEADAISKTGTEAKTTIPQINTLNSSLEKIGLTGSGLTDVLSSVNQALSDHHANIQESQDYLKQYNQAAGENTKYTQDQERQTYSLMNSLGMLGTAQNMYNQYMQDGIFDSTESAHVQEALAAATKMMGDAGIDANTNLAGLPGALQALASAAQAAMAAIQAAISQAQSAVAQAHQPMPGTKPSQMADSPPYNQNININMNNNTFPSGTNPGEVFSTFVNGTRVIGV